MPHNSFTIPKTPPIAEVFLCCYAPTRGTNFVFTVCFVKTQWVTPFAYQHRTSMQYFIKKHKRDMLESDEAYCKNSCMGRVDRMGRHSPHSHRLRYIQHRPDCRYRPLPYVQSHWFNWRGNLVILSSCLAACYYQYCICTFCRDSIATHFPLVKTR